MEIVVKENLPNLGRYAAERFVALASDNLDRGDRFSVALSGGSTPKALYRLLSSDDFRYRIDWNRIHFFFSDERCVPADSPESNYRLAAESLLNPLGVAEANVFRWRGEDDPEKAASKYEFEIKSFFRSDLPVFDLILLGMGADGHTASLFPYSPAIHETKRLAVSNWVEKLTADRLTFTYPLINNAANVMLLVAGYEKADALREVLAGSKSIDDLPARGVQPISGSLTWVVDAPAASLLNATEI